MENEIISAQNNKDALLTAVETIKTAILKSQYEAGKLANAQQLSLYYGIGRYISENSRKGKWGTGAIESISERLQRELPGLRGFSAGNLKKMRIFFEKWESLDSKSFDASNDFTLTVSIDGNFPATEFLGIGFSNHYEILSHTESLDERYYYIKKAFNEKMSCSALKKSLAQDAFHNQSEIPNNFVTTISNSKQALKAIKTFKDSYFLDFINTEELDLSDEDVDEKVVENEIIKNIKKFIMTFGRDFAFVGNQYHLEIYGHDHYSDLLFFNRELNCLVVVELKMGEFKPSYLGQLCTYLSLVDDKLKKEHENPAIGIILCKTADKNYVEYCVRDYKKPMGVATYKTYDEMDDELKKVLPPVSELQNLLENNSGEEK